LTLAVGFVLRLLLRETPCFKGFGWWSSLFRLIVEIYFHLFVKCYWQFLRHDLDCSRCQQTRHTNNKQTTTMKLKEIKDAVDQGGEVYWASNSYKVKFTPQSGWLIVCSNGYCFPLTDKNGNLECKESDFYIKPSK
jgi:hypothetical protein